MDNMEDDITRAMNDLNMGRGQAHKAQLKQILQADGEYNAAALDAVVVQIKANKRDWDTITIDMLAGAYQKKVARSVVHSCALCRGGGWLKAVLIEGRWNGRDQTYVWNYWNSEKYFKFVQFNPQFVPREAIMPCRCENGERHNHKNGHQWLQDEQRDKYSGYAIHYQGEEDVASATEDYYRAELIIKINEVRKGNQYDARKIASYPDIAALQQRLMTTLASTEDSH
jgi:hypothetical protein